jgi:hypothetical protein
MPRYAATMSRRLDLATIRLRIQNKYLWLAPLGVGTVLSGCSLLPLQDRAATASSPSGSSILILRQADARGYAAGFEAGKRLQALRDRESAGAAAKSSAAASSDTAPPVAVPAAAVPALQLPSGTVPPAMASSAPALPASASALASTPASSVLVPSASAAPVPGKTAQAAAPRSPLTPPAPPQPPAAGNFVPRGVASPLGPASDPF